MERTLTDAEVNAGKAKAAESSLDQALSAISGPQNMSTVSKSSADWDRYKEASGLQDELETAAKNGYLSKKEFLDRCDVRQFEQERDLRQERRLAESGGNGK